MKLLHGFVASILIHTLVFSLGLGFVTWRNARSEFVTVIDLKSSSLLLRPKNARTLAAALLSEPWVLAAEKARPARPAPIKRMKAAPPEPAEEPAPAFSGGSEGVAAGVPGPGTVAEWVPAAAASRIPEWIEGLITEEDYPAEARKQGKEGKVVARIIVGADGQVRDARITEGSYPEFEQLVLERLKTARFRPGLDRNGCPVAVRMTIPVVFELQ